MQVHSDRPPKSHRIARLRPVQMFQQFVRTEAGGGVILLASALVAIVLANTALAHYYFEVWETPVTVGAGPWVLTLSLHHWINDGLMMLFFFVVGLEIKRELLVGELSSPRKAALPIMAALGGMLVPAAIYMAFNLGGEGAHGWGIPMATDIAFSLGVLALLGSRVPTALKVFLAALAIADDLGAVLVIAFFYTSELSMISLAVAGLVYLALIVMNKAGVEKIAVYGIAGAVLWLAVLNSGVHATIAGVLLATTIPVRTHLDKGSFMRRTQSLLHSMSGLPDNAGPDREVILEIENTCERALSPLARIEHSMHPWVAYFIMPVFAFANAGVAFGENAGAMLLHPVSIGVALGLALGKQAGVMLFSWLAVRMKAAALPAGVTWMSLYGVAWLCGIGFTMSLFVSGLAFDDARLLDAAKVGVFLGSLASGVIGWALLARTSKAMVTVD